MRAQGQPVGSQGSQQPDSTRRRGQAEQSAGKRDPGGLDKDVAHQMPGARPQRLPNRQFFGPRIRPNEEQVGQIDDPDEQEHKHSGLQQQQRGADRRHVVSMQWNHH